MRHIRAMMLRLLLLGCLTLVSTASAASLKLDSLTIGPTTYSNVTVLGANTTDLYFTHAQGIANVKLKYLKPELQKKFNYDPKAAAEAEKRQSESDLQYQTTQATTFFGHSKGSEAAEKPPLTSEESLADPVSEKSLLGRPAPALEAEQWLGDKPVLDGKFVLIDFWAPWSIPCRKSIPELNALQKKFKDKLVVVGWTSEGEEASVNDLKMEFSSGLDSKAKLRAAAGVTSVPCVLLVDSKGIVRYEGHPSGITEKKLEALMAKSEQESK
jgi:thiol-disulfide isomerase/thioredoxin